MRALVFSDPGAKARLEAIIHPLVRAEIDRRIACVAPGSVALLDLPLLAESPAWRERCDLVWVVDCAGNADPACRGAQRLEPPSGRGRCWRRRPAGNSGSRSPTR